MSDLCLVNESGDENSLVREKNSLVSRQEFSNWRAIVSVLKDRKTHFINHQKNTTTMALKVKAKEKLIKIGKYADTYRYVMVPELYALFGTQY